MEDKLRISSESTEEIEVDRQTIARQYTSVDDLIGNPPGWLLRSGISMVALVVAVFFSLAFVIKYPDKISAPAVITSTEPPVDIVVRVTAPLDTLMVRNGESVDEDQILGYMESTVRRDHLEKLRLLIEDILHCDDLKKFGRLQIPEEQWILGELQGGAEQLLRTMNRHHLLSKLINPGAKISSIHDELENIAALDRHIEKEAGLYKREQALQKKETDRHRTLLREGVISTQEYEQKQRDSLLLWKQERAIDATRLQNTIRKSQLTTQEVEIREEYGRQLLESWLEIRDVAGELRAQIKEWEYNFGIRSSQGGAVFLQEEVKQGRQFRAGDFFCSVVSSGNDQLLALGMVPADGRGKIDTGTKVLLRLQAFPYKEYGSIEDTLSYLSTLPQIDPDAGFQYEARVDLDSDLISTSGFSIPYHPNMPAEMLLITRDQSIAHRIFTRFLNLLEN